MRSAGTVVIVVLVLVLLGVASAVFGNPFATPPAYPLAVKQWVDGDIAVYLSPTVPNRVGTLWVKSNVPWTLAARVEGAAIVSFRNRAPETLAEESWRIVEDGDEVASGDPGLFGLRYEVRIDAGPRATVTFEIGWSR